MRKKLFLWGSIYFIFVVYGSLVPLELKVITFEHAIAKYSSIPYLDLNMFSRADWVANILLYIPLAFMFSGAVHNNKNTVLSIIFIVIVLAFCIGLAHLIEFIQLFFPKRTVSQNDLIAETMGSCIGVFLWLMFGTKFTSMLGDIGFMNQDFFKQSLILYLLAYLFLAFFPFDFIVSYQELLMKIEAYLNGETTCFDSFLRCSVSSISEIVIAIPLGVQVAMFVKYPPHRLFVAIMVGLILGSVIEIIQLFLISGVTSFLSVLFKTTGFFLGSYLYSNIDRLIKISSNYIERIIILLAIPYVFVVAAINGWFNQKWLSFREGINTIGDIQFLPFSYHYNVTEMMAMVSLLATSGMYGVIGFFYAMLPNKHNKWLAGLYAAIFCFIIETGKLFLLYKHPDPTNILIAFFASMFCFLYLLNIKKWINDYYIKEV